MQNKNLRPKFHITATGWINDPNGLIKYNGLYHVFYQHYPYDIHWNSMHWGHKVSKDLLHWEELPIALYPNENYDRDGCFSGSAIEYQDKLYLIYTGFTRNDGGDSQRQVQCLASSSDGISFTKHGVVIGEKELPNEYSIADFRDPKLFRYNNSFYCVIAARKKEGKGRILLFQSNNLFDWRFVSDIFGKDCKGKMIECPDYNPNLNLLIYSEICQPKEDKIHLNLHTTRWCLGKFNNENKFINTNTGIIDYGFDFYAAQSFVNDNILIAWLDMWDRTKPSEKYGFAGMLSIPRKIEIVDGRLYQSPVIFGNKICETMINQSFTGNLKYGYLEINVDNLEKLSLKVRVNDNSYILFELKDNWWILDRSRMEEKIIGAENDKYSLNGIRMMPYLKQESHQIIVVLDEFSVEIFVDGMAISSQIYQKYDAEKFELLINASRCKISQFEFK